jgi:hypothetical protein
MGKKYIEIGGFPPPNVTPPPDIHDLLFVLSRKTYRLPHPDHNPFVIEQLGTIGVGLCNNGKY